MVLAVTRRGKTLAARFSGAIGARVIGPERLGSGGLKSEVERAFKTSPAIVFVCASGIAVRTIAPLLRGKDIDPAVVVMDEAGRFVISLVSGHLGGANALARRIASITGAAPVITTATDVHGLPCAEDVAQKFSLRIEDARRIKAVNSAILAGKRIAVVDRDAGRRKAMRRAFPGKKPFTFTRALPPDPGAFGAFIVISPFIEKLPPGIEKKALVMRPGEFVAGVGCRRGVSAGDMERAVEAAFRGAGVSPLSIKRLATIDIKRDEMGLLRFAGKAGLEVEFLSAGRLSRAARKKRASGFVRSVTGTPAVCEPAALLISGARRLWIKKTKLKNVTVAAARARSPWSA